MSDTDSIETRWHEVETDDQFVVSRTQDVEPILNQNKKRQNDGLDGYSPSRDLKQIASLPLVVAESWMKTDGVNWLQLTGSDREKYLRKKLNAPDNAFLRTDNRGLL